MKAAVLQFCSLSMPESTGITGTKQLPDFSRRIEIQIDKT
jgi:hypothetical protein